MAYSLTLNLVETEAFIDGLWIEGDATFEVLNPADGTLIARVADLGPGETRVAIEAAHRAFPIWAARTAKERGVILRRWSDLMLAHADDLARLMTAEQGKPLAESRGEVAYGAAFIDWFADEAKRAYGHTIPTPMPGKRLASIKQPVGVCAAIAPWNFPIAMITRKVGPALAAGCTVVVKPAAETPLCALAIARLAVEAGVPAGVLNVVTGKDSSAIGKALCDDSRVRKLSFTGSTPVGKILYAQCAGTMKKLSLELGGNAPFIVFDDAELEAAVDGAIASKYRNTGQTCVCANRLLVQAGIHDAFVSRLAEKVAAMKVGPGTGEGVTIGPLINDKAIAKVESLVREAVEAGAKVVTGGQRHDLGGLFYQPTVLTEATPDMRLFQEEIFGPVAPVVKFHTEDQAIELANATPFGLAAYFYSRDVGRCWRVAEAIEAGMVGINEGLISTEVAPFGGVKESGLGREGSSEGLDEYFETKYLCFGGVG
ncbi:MULTISPECIES: NAD-dependent succinate-semialdehyde dehydrogenase [unclassified Caulobacter]|uniref:NAD-dependent succinate-semialdehyde dehydrogenase n=1 Tax=unclassified Caulobacter TaxID=2648921 RepID=UPI0006FE5829|nr:MULTISPECIES: NAD-dependent succinate-semialdehyde dehydrogenase [unclassified Caulobacter]KQV54855.1 NAD-dependent succinate-semialdehyde dehydrogenase [Caulobacter sp. Root342]KQV68538.1 NAD-dependent succinate-semialdehyde dehydrogenase [Caulobacter sp. Root343]